MEAALISEVIPIFKEDKKIVSGKNGYLDELGVEYTPRLLFHSPRVLKWVIKKSKKALKKELITKEQKWLGAYFSHEIEQDVLPPLSVRWIDDEIGFGVFAEKDLPKCTYIGEYAGLLRKRKKRRDQKNSYTFEYLIGETIDTPFTIDAKDHGNHTRFINHADGGNCDPMLIYHSEIMRVIIYTNRAVKKSEQLLYDYGEEYWAKREDPESLLRNDEDSYNVGNQQGKEPRKKE